MKSSVFRTVLQSLLVAGLFFAPSLMLAVKGADKPAAKTDAKDKQEAPGAGRSALDLSYIPADFQLALVLHPRRVLTSTMLADLPVDGIIESLRMDSLTDPRKIEQLIVFYRLPRDFDPAELFPRPAGQPPGEKEKSPATKPEAERDHESKWVGLIIQMSEPTEARKAFTKLATNAKAIVADVHAGRAYFKSPIEGYDFKTRKTYSAGWLACCNVDDRTLLVAEEQTLFRMLAAKSVKNPLREQLARAEPGADAVVAFSIEERSELAGKLSKVLERVTEPRLSSLPVQIKAGWLTVRLTSGPLVKGSLVAVSEDAARDLETSGRQGLEMVQSLYGEFGKLLEMTPYATDLQPALAFGGKLLEGVVLARKGSELTVEVKNFGMISQLLQDMRPFINREWAKAEDAFHKQSIKQISSAMKSYQLYEASLEPTQKDDDLTDAKGRPYLGWRIKLLGSVGHYREFRSLKYDEPADGAANKPWLEKMPRVYLGSSTAKNVGKTRFVVLTGPDTMFPQGRMIPAKLVVDGLENTILLIELPVERAIPWTSITDIPFDLNQPLQGIAPIPKTGMRIVMGDGAIKTLNPEIAPEVFKALVTPAGKESVDLSDAFLPGTD